MFDYGDESGGERHAAGGFVDERAYGVFPSAESVMGVGDVQSGVGHPEETDYFGFVPVGSVTFAFRGEGNAESVFFGCGGDGQCGSLGGNRLEEPGASLEAEYYSPVGCNQLSTTDPAHGSCNRLPNSCTIYQCVFFFNAQLKKKNTYRGLGGRKCMFRLLSSPPI